MSKELLSQPKFEWIKGTKARCAHCENVIQANQYRLRFSAWKGTTFNVSKSLCKGCFINLVKQTGLFKDSFRGN